MLPLIESTHRSKSTILSQKFVSYQPHQSQQLHQSHQSHQEELIFQQSKILFLEADIPQSAHSRSSKMFKAANSKKTTTAALESWCAKRSRYTFSSRMKMMRDPKSNNNENKLNNLELNLKKFNSKCYEKDKIQNANPSCISSKCCQMETKTNNMESKVILDTNQMTQPSQILSSSRTIQASMQKDEQKILISNANEFSPSFKVIPLNKDQQCQISTKFKPLKQQTSNIKYGQEDRKRLFGRIHSLMINKIDYLTKNRWQTVDQNCKISFIKTNTQKRLQQQIQVLKNCQTQPKRLYQNIQNSTLTNQNSNKNNNKTLHQDIVNVNMGRANIVNYLKNNQATKLLDLVTSSHSVDKYSDVEFPHNSTQIIGNRNVQWVYIEPNSTVNTFGHSQQLYNYQVPHQQPICLQFLRSIYHFQPELVKRLFQPVRQNVFAVWLFVNGGFQPIFVDGFFPLDQKLNHYYGGSSQQLWLPILIKCFCKIFNTFHQTKIQQLTPQQTYIMLTGLSLIKIPQQNLTCLSSISQIVSTQLEHNNTCILYDEDKTYIIKEYDDDLYIYSPLTKQQINLSQYQLHRLKMHVIPAFHNLYAYSLRAHNKTLSKLEVNCRCSTQLYIAIERNKKSSSAKRVYIYESINAKNSSQIKLVLKHEKQIKEEFKCKLKRGSYKIFIQDGQKKIHSLLSDKGSVKWEDSTTSASGQYQITLFTTQEVQLSDIEALKKKGSQLEDSSNVYENAKKQ